MGSVDMVKKIALESITILLICVSLLLLKSAYSEPSVESLKNEHKQVNDSTTVKQIEPVDITLQAIDINLATEQELQKISGVGEVIAKRIIEDRQQNGYYQTTEDIIRVKGIGPKTYQKMRQLIVVNKRNLMFYLGY